MLENPQGNIYPIKVFKTRKSMPMQIFKKHIGFEFCNNINKKLRFFRACMEKNLLILHNKIFTSAMFIIAVDWLVYCSIFLAFYYFEFPPQLSANQHGQIDQSCRLVKMNKSKNTAV